MFLYDLPRFSVDLDFNLLHVEHEELVYNRMKQLLLHYGTLHDEAKKYFGPIFVLDYGKDERKLKIEISNRQFDNHYETKNNERGLFGPSQGSLRCLLLRFPTKERVINH